MTPNILKSVLLPVSSVLHPTLIVTCLCGYKICEIIRVDIDTNKR